jgi:hypothetical protein
MSFLAKMLANMPLQRSAADGRPQLSGKSFGPGFNELQMHEEGAGQAPTHTVGAGTRTGHGVHGGLALQCGHAG